MAQQAERGPAAALEMPAAKGTMLLKVSEGRLFRLGRDVGNVLVGDAAIADVQLVSPRALYVYGRRPGQTTITATGAGTGADGLVAQITIRIARGADAAQAALPPESRGSVQLGFTGNRLGVRGDVADLGEALDVNAAARAYNTSSQPPLDRSRLAGTQQITLRVRIAEVSRTELNRLGINLSVLARPGSFAFNLLTNSFTSNAVPTAESAGLLSGGLTTNRVNSEALVNALQREGLLTLLAEPNLTTLSGETARFLAGGEVPVPVPQALGVTTIQYKPFGVQLSFTPTLLPGGRIAMRVRPEVSQISNANAVQVQGYNVPSFTTRSAETNVEMASGQTVAIAGLFQRSNQSDIDRVPLLGDVPVLGSLFRSTRYQRNETELVILITPYLSQPTERGAEGISLPTDPAPRRAAGRLAPPRRAADAVAAGFTVN